MENEPVCSINLVVLNGERYVRHCLEALRKQSFDHRRLVINILDNGSTDRTKEMVKEFMPFLNDFNRVTFIERLSNLGMWGGQEELLKHSDGEYVIALAVDVILDTRFVERAVMAGEKDPHIGAIQAKIYRFDVATVGPGMFPDRDIIDTCGFRVFRSRRVINIGHGEHDHGQFAGTHEIFGVEGAVPVLRRAALEDIRVQGEIADHDLFWYAEDLDIAWRLRLAGWKEVYDPSVVAWHDRQTTKKLRKNFRDFLNIRRTIPLRKRRLEWRNVRFTIVKNDYIINILKDLPAIIFREAAMTLYLVLFEPRVLTEMPTLFRLLPKMISKRRAILSSARVSPAQIRKFFH